MYEIIPSPGTENKTFEEIEKRTTSKVGYKYCNLIIIQFQEVIFQITIT